MAGIPLPVLQPPGRGQTPEQRASSFSQCWWAGSRLWAPTLV